MAAFLLCSALTTWAFGTTICDARLAKLIEFIDGELERIPHGPAAYLGKAISDKLPISECSAAEFRQMVARSKYFVLISEEPTYYIALLVNGSAEVGLSFRKITESVDKAYSISRK